MTERAAVGVWVFDDYDECGVHYRCSCCSRSIIVVSKFAAKPGICPWCGSEMRAAKL